MEDTKKKFKREEHVPESSFLDNKIAAVNESAMPEAQKIALLKKIGAIKEDSTDGKVPFIIYAKIKKISVDQHKAMLAYPKAKGVSLAPINQWEEIFKEF